MSREERRAYERQMKSLERGPALPPAARARAERNAARRAARRTSSSPPGASAGLRFWIRGVLIAVAAGFLGFSIQWSEGMPRALYVGLIVAAVTFLLILGFRFLRGRVARAP
jgi:hypothetical protein